MNFYSSLPDQTKTDINLLKAALRDLYYTQARLYNMRVKLHELRQGSYLETYINDLDTLTHHLDLPEQQKIHYFVFELKPRLKLALLIRQPQTYNDAVTFAKRKHHFTDTNSDTQLMDLLQGIRKEVSLKHPGIKQEPYSAPISGYPYKPPSTEHLSTSNGYTKSQGSNKHIPYPICCTFGYQPCRPPTTVI